MSKNARTLVLLAFLLELLVALPLSTVASAQSHSARVGYRLQSPERPISKIAYFTTLLDEREDLDGLFTGDEALRQIARDRHSRLTAAGEDESAMIDALLLSDGEVSLIADRLAELMRRAESLRQLYEEHVVASGCYARYTDERPAEEVVREVWAHDADAINRLLRTYMRGERPLYLVDSISWTPGSRKHVALLRESQRLLTEVQGGDKLFYHLPFYAAELYLDLNDRDETAVYEPLGETVNEVPYSRVASTDWDAYPYSALLVLGFGPDNYDFPLNPGGKIRLRIAAEKFKEGVAPFIIISGGKVYPYKTRTVEAYGMKQYLIEQCGIPADRIIMEPHARHTTSNIRNTVRILFRTGFPMEKPFLVSSAKGHIDTVMSEGFRERCQRDMGLVPCKFVKRVGANFAELLPLPISLQINAKDPLDA